MKLSVELPPSSAAPLKALSRTLGKRKGRALLETVYGSSGSTAGSKSKSNGDENSARDAAKKRLEEEQNRLEQLAREKLAKISPRVLLKIEAVLAAVQGRSKTAFLRFCGIDRFVWWVGATAKGASESPADVADLGVVVAHWLANRRLLEDLEPKATDVDLLIALNSDFEDTRRIAQSEIRFTWVTRLICEEMAKAASGRGYADQLPELTVPAVQEVMTVLAKSVGKNYEAFSAKSGSPGQKLARALSTKASSLSERSDLLSVLFDRKVETQPFIDLDPKVVPAALRTASQGLEVALLELIREKTPPSSNARGNVYEDAVIGCLKEVAPPGLQLLDVPARVYVGPKNEGQVDFACRFDDRYLLLGEAKSYVVSQASQSVVNDFKPAMSAAVDQLQVRRKSYADGNPLKTDSGTVVGVDDVSVSYGIAVPLHSYATAVWNHGTLADLEMDLTNVSIIPLHQLIILFQTMWKPDVLAEYLDWRAKWLASEVTIFDETDVLVQFLASQSLPANNRVQIHSAPGMRRMQRFYAVPYDVAVTEMMPTDRRAWVNRLWRVTHSEWSSRSKHFGRLIESMVAE